MTSTTVERLLPADARTLRTYFNDLTNEVFAQLEIDEPRVVDYVSDVLARFARVDRLYRIHDQSGRRLETLVEMLLEEQNPAGQARYEGRAFRRHIGDYTLFMSGLFRDWVERQGTLDYYMTEGQRSYERVARTELGDDAPLYEALARRFELYAGALDFMRKTRFQSMTGGKALLLEFASAIVQRLGAAGLVH